MAKSYESLRESLKDLFDHANWGDFQTKSYNLIKLYQESKQGGYLAAQHYQDKHVITDNINGQVWYQAQKHCVRSIVSQLINQMEVVKEHCLNQPETKMLNVVVDFKQFQLHVHYFQQVNELISLQIYVTREKKKNYLAYYIRGRVVAIPSHIKSQIQVPELADLNNLVGINETMIAPEILLNFFLEIILYYDQTETIGELRLMEDHPEKITEIIERGNLGST
jgi:hypothetical protein